jgi:hypothetical protein
MPTALSRPTPRMCYIHYFNTNIKQNKKEQSNLLFLNTTGDATETLVAAIYRLFESDGGHTRAQCFLSTRCTSVSIRRSRVVQQQYAYMLPYGPRTENALYLSKGHQRQLGIFLATPKFQSSWTLRLKISTSVDHWKSTQKEGTPDLWNVSRLYHCMQTLGPFSLSAWIEQAVHCWDKRATGLLITCRNRGYCMLSISVSKLHTLRC